MNSLFIDLMPIDRLFKFIEARDKKLNYIVNALSLTNAIGWSAFFNGFSGSKNEKTNYTDLLPMPIDKEDKLKNDINQPTDETLKALKLLFKQKKIPRPVLLDLGSIGLLEKISE